MKAEKRNNLLVIMRDNPGMTVKDYAHLTGLPSSAINQFLVSDQDGVALVLNGTIAAQPNGQLPIWARVDPGSKEKKACVPYAEPVYAEPKAVLVIPEPPTTGHASIDTLASGAHKSLQLAATSRSTKQKNIAFENFARQNEALVIMASTLADNNALMQQVIDAKDQAIAAKDQVIEYQAKGGRGGNLRQAA